MRRYLEPPNLAGALAVAVISVATMASANPTKVYVPTGDAAEIVTIDPHAGKITGRIEGLAAAHGLAATPDGRRLVVGSFDERAPGETMPKKPAGVSAADHAAHHAPKAQKGAEAVVSTVSIVDSGTGAIVRQIDVPGAVHHVAVSPDGRSAAVTHPGEDSISVIDLGSSKIVATVATGATPNYAAFSPDGGVLYVSNAGDDSIAILSTNDWKKVGQISVGESPEHIVVSKDGERVYVNNVASGSVSVIDVSAGKVIEVYEIGEPLHGIDLSDDGRTLFVAVVGGDRLVAIDVRDGARRERPLSPGPYHLGVIRGEGLIYVSSAGSPVLWVLDATTLETKATIDLPGRGHQFAQSGGN